MGEIDCEDISGTERECGLLSGGRKEGDGTRGKTAEEATRPDRDRLEFMGDIDRQSFSRQCKSDVDCRIGLQFMF